MPRPETCSVCGAEVRFGHRAGPDAYWMHQDPAVDEQHRVKLGYLMTDEDWARIAAQLDEPRTLADGTVYTTRTWKSKGKGETEGQDQEAVDERKIIPAPEILARPISKGDELWPGGCSTIANLAEKCGWRWSATYSRGPRVHGSLGTFLGMSDYIIMRLALDETDKRAVGFWVDTKFDHAWLARVDLENRRYMIEPPMANSNGLKDWIRGGTT